MLFHRSTALFALALSATVQADSSATTTSSKTTSSSTTEASTSSPTAVIPSTTSLPDLFSAVPACGLVSYNAVSRDSGCVPSDLGCVCQDPDSLTAKMSLWVDQLCDGVIVFDSDTWLSTACSAYDDVQNNSTAVASATAFVSSEVAAATRAASTNPAAKTTKSSSSSSSTRSATGTTTGTAAAATTSSSSGANTVHLLVWSSWVAAASFVGLAAIL